MEIIFLEEVQFEISEAIHFYEIQYEGLGKKLGLELSKKLDIIKLHPESFSKFTTNSRKAVLNKFPYNIYFSLTPKEIIVLAFAHQHRKPGYWTKRISKIS